MKYFFIENYQNFSDILRNLFFVFFVFKKYFRCLSLPLLSLSLPLCIYKLCIEKYFSVFRKCVPLILLSTICHTAGIKTFNTFLIFFKFTVKLTTENSLVKKKVFLSNNWHILYSKIAINFYQIISDISMFVPFLLSSERLQLTVKLSF